MSFKKFFTINFDKFVLIVFLLYLYQLPLNIYSIYLHNYNERLLNNYGYCEKESYGYLENINKNKNNQNIYSYNFGDFSRSSSVFFFKLKNNFDDKKVVILNYYSNNIVNDKKIIEELKEHPFNETQRILSEDKSSAIFVAKCYISYELVNKILSLGPSIKIIKPKSLQDKLIKKTLAHLSNYKKK